MRHTKKGFGRLGAAVVLMAVLVFSAASVISLSDDERTDTYLGEDAPVYISSAEELAALAADVNDGNNKSGIRYELSNDIDLSEYGAWTPIGWNATHAFAGVFDGKGYTISGLMINNATLEHAGLFGYVNAGGKIENVVIKDAAVTAKTYVGGLVGQLYDATVVNCHVTGDIKGSHRVGGVVGSAYGNTSAITGCSFEGSVTATVGTTSTAGDSAGGIVGYIAYTKISQCYAEGDVKGRDSVGGIVGHISSTASWASVVTDCYFSGSVSGRNYIGGIVGDLNLTNANANILITKCYAVGTVSGTSGVGGIAGYVHNGKVVDCVALNVSVTADSNAGRVVGYVNPSMASGGTISNNAAFAGMAAGNVAFPAGQNTGSGNNGTDMNISEINTDGTLGGRFASPPWIIEDGKLPVFGYRDTPEYLLPESITADMFESIGNVVYNGSAHTPDVTLSGVDPNVTFVVSEYKQNTDAGKASVVIVGTGEYGGTVTLYFTILPKSLTNELQPIDGEFVYNGSEWRPAVVYGLTEGDDYLITYLYNVNAGTAVVTVVGIGNYAGTLIEEFVISPRPITIIPDAGQGKPSGSDDPTLLYTVTGGFDGMVLGGALSREPGEGHGKYMITLGTLGGPNYEITFIDDVVFEISAVGGTFDAADGDEEPSMLWLTAAMVGGVGAGVLFAILAMMYATQTRMDMRRGVSQSARGKE